MAPPSPQEIERKKQVTETLTNFRDALKRITNTAMNVVGQKGDQDFSILQQFFKPKSPSSQSENDNYGDEDFSGSPVRSPIKVETDVNNDTFITGTGAGMDPEEVKSPKTATKNGDDGALVLVKEGLKDDLEVPEDEDDGVVADPMAVTGSRKVAQEVDEFGLREDGEIKKPVDLLKPGFIDLARLSAGVAFGIQSLQSSKPRIGTVTALKRTHLLCINQHDYKKIILEVERLRESNKVMLAKNVMVFSSMVRSKLVNFMADAKLITVKKDHEVQK